MHKLIPLIYFYLVSLIGLIILIIGIFSGIHVLVNIFSYSQYPLSYDTTQRCVYPQPVPLMKGVSTTQVTIAQPEPSGITVPTIQQTIAQPVNAYYDDCLKQVALERKQAEVADIEKAISYSFVGLLVFGIHFYFARKKSN